MVLRREARERRLLAEDGDNGVHLLAARDHAGGREVRQTQKQGVLPRLDIGEPGVERRDLVAELSHRRLDLGRVFAGFAELPDLLRDGVAAAFELFGDGEDLAAARVEFEHLVHERRIDVTVAEALADLVGFFTNALDV